MDAVVRNSDEIINSYITPSLAIHHFTNHIMKVHQIFIGDQPPRASELIGCV
ncbi:hypothetical protein KIN20_025725 [Parelaphostrongylus tenuis]|uniref:Uncharacterized protein n=1 Tax=Parelaphostrongylus tenuis TaxID=148309 RepID=A0AAD5NAZ8_PARTN|nr:hypothetical protein KIN20_025725 [Parelaphostrongylus tenuis]